tara:strand:+ start:324 stop:542 length:219 start_codon:yes stop_codon:yes gene_type:complete
MSDREIMKAKRAGNNTPPPSTINQPDARKHQIVSFIKSGIRIAGYCFIPFNLVTATILLILSEVVGIVEELV